MFLMLKAVLHPTPAVCGRPRAEAKAVLADNEPFDRGYYAGPFGWISGSAAEFVVAIRSALVQAAPQCTPPQSQPQSRLHKPDAEQQQSATYGNAAQSNKANGPAQTISLFAGVGIVKGSIASSEWQVSIPSHGLQTAQSGLLSSLFTLIMLKIVDQLETALEEHCVDQHLHKPASASS